MAFSDRLATIWRNRLAPVEMLQHSHLSCSQFAEDLIVERLLHPNAIGTYVDVGAHHPVKASNTYRFYAHGWQGLTIDPNPKFASDFRRFRPRDRHLVEGVALEVGRLTYFEFKHDVYNTLSDERAQEVVGMGIPLLNRSTVPCRPLSEIVDEVLLDRQIDLLNVDCEGRDLDVLQSLDLTKRRPTVLMIEDYLPLGDHRAAQELSDLRSALVGWGYSPIAQTGWTMIFVANDWERLFLRSPAFSIERVQQGYMPGLSPLSSKAGQPRNY